MWYSTSIEQFWQKYDTLSDPFKILKTFRYMVVLYFLIFIISYINGIDGSFRWLFATKNQQKSKWRFFDFLKIIFHKKLFCMRKKQILFYFIYNFSLSTICKFVIYNKNIFHGNVDWNFIRDCSVKITLLFKSKSKSRIFNKIFNNKIFSNPELDKIYIVIIF